MSAVESNHGHPRLVLLLLLAFLATGCFGEFEDPITNTPAKLSIQLEGSDRESYGEPGDLSGYTIVFSEQDALVQGIHMVETPIPILNRWPVAVFELTNAIHPRIDDNIDKPCLDDPIAIRDDSTGETVATLDGLCPDSFHISTVSVSGVLDDRPFAWSLNSKQIFPDESP